MMSTKTEHYQLNQYEPGDSFLRTDFNEDNAKIDAALGGMCQVKVAVYTGTGTAHTIHLGATPKAVIVRRVSSAPEVNHMTEITCIPVMAVTGSTGNVVRIVENGFSVTSHGLVNGLNDQFLYIAIL